MVHYYSLIRVSYTLYLQGVLLNNTLIKKNYITKHATSTLLYFGYSMLINSKHVVGETPPHITVNYDFTSHKTPPPPPPSSDPRVRGESYRIRDTHGSYQPCTV